MSEKVVGVTGLLNMKYAAAFGFMVFGGGSIFAAYCLQQGYIVTAMAAGSCATLWLMVGLVEVLKMVLTTPRAAAEEAENERRRL